MRAFIVLASAILLSIGVGIGVLAGVGSTATTNAITLLGDGLGLAHFGQSRRVAVANLEKLLGSPNSATPTSYNLCDIDSELQWPTMTAYFFHDRFVGYVTGDVADSTAKSLRVGDSAVQARRLYGSAFKESGVNGGVWSALTPSGILRGYLTTPPGQDIASGTTGSIANIAAGNLGCPAVAPGGP